VCRVLEVHAVPIAGGSERRVGHGPRRGSAPPAPVSGSDVTGRAPGAGAVATRG
jgi:hypothetical protein